MGQSMDKEILIGGLYMIRVGIVGGTGKLGKDILGLLLDHTEITVGAVIVRKSNRDIGRDIGFLIDNRLTNIHIVDDILESSDHCDVYIDCTNANSFINDNYDAYVLVNKPIIIATTGFNSDHIEQISKLAQSTAVVICPNFSIGVLKFLKLVEMAAREFGMNSDIDIFELHHKHKIDKPSGTAIKMVDTIKGTGVEDDISIHSVRAGNIIGEHSVVFTTDENERIELSHKIYSRESFAKGVIQTIKWIVHNGTGLYGLEDIFN